MVMFSWLGCSIGKLIVTLLSSRNAGPVRDVSGEKIATYFRREKAGAKKWRTLGQPSRKK
jgi:hypothetical protein